MVKKQVKKVLSTMFVFSVIISIGFVIFAYGDEINNTHLKCSKSGDFTILIVSDPQCDSKKQWQEAKDELEILAEKSNPDFVVINGDMNSKNCIPADMWDIFISPLTKRGIYWSTTNGNHDPFKYEYYKMYKSYDKCLNSTVSALDKNYDFTRPMNYVIPVYDNDGKKIVFAIYCMDSGQSGYYGYEGVTKRQAQWYTAQSNRLKELNKGVKVTSLMCMHIPFVQTLDMYYSTNGAGNVSGEKCGDVYKTYGVANEPNFDYKSYVCENNTVLSKFKIHTTAAEYDVKMFDRILNQGDVKAVIFGHDHRTNIIGSYKGVLLGFAGKISTGCYCDNLCRGGRVIRFNQTCPEKFTAEWIGSLETSIDQPAIYSDGTIAE